VGLSRLDLAAFSLMDDGSILMSFNKSVDIPGLGVVDDSDIVQFTPTRLGDDTIGAFAWYFDGSDVGLTTGGEDIDAIGFAPDGRLLISTKGSFEIDDLNGEDDDDELEGKDEDLFVFNATSMGADTAGSWEPYFDGSDVALTRGGEDVNGLWVDGANGNLYLTTKGDFEATGSAGSISGDRDDIFICTPLALGDTTDCTFAPFFDGDQARFDHRIDGIFISQGGAMSVAWIAEAEGASADADQQAQYEIVADTVVSTKVDDELDEFDREEEGETISGNLYLPLISR